MSAALTKPAIPDHEMLRVIGRGAYGEIWLARGLTGALRAVKVVYRSTFESARAFNREFEGMSSFEPISRAHDGFMNILHVGRSEAFFYYIMELADDHATGRQIDVENYVPRTLKTEMERRGRIPASECVQLGLWLSAALAALHGHGLAHRDIKPANIIFVNGAPKLADIGLVAVSGQRSFVGTEGYTPPEGPGTASADLYSLGKVLYEISMGKDRLDFPEVTTRLGEFDDKDVLLQLNGVLLKACANHAARRYENAQQMHDDLRRLEVGWKRKRGLRRPIIAGLAATGVLAAVIATQLFHREDEAALAEAIITTDPPGALVLLGDRMHNSPATFGLPPGKYPLRVMLAGFDAVETKIELKPNQHSALPPLKLRRCTGSLALAARPAEADFEVRGPEKIVRSGTTPATLHELPTGVYDVQARRGEWRVAQRVEIKRGETAVSEIVFASGAVAATSTPDGAEIFAEGKSLGRTPMRVELPAGAHELAAQLDGWPGQQQRVIVEADRETVVNFNFANGSVKITSAPGGALVVRDGVELGRTPLLIEEVKPGAVAYELRLPGYKPVAVTGTVAPQAQAFLAARLEKKLGPEPGQPWTNSLGMKFVDVGAIRMCIWETRVRDYAAFCAATARHVEAPDFAQTETHPVVKVSWADAEAFCKWLTQKELDEDLLEDGQFYRLPTDAEWSLAAGLPDEGGATPEERDGKIRGQFPWGKSWPPPARAGNYAGAGDGFAQTAPVGSFEPNEHGLFDLGGNVWEWCEEGYKGSGRFKDWGVLRGGSWANGSRSEMLLSYRNVVDRNDRDVIYGFRCLLVPEPSR